MFDLRCSRCGIDTGDFVGGMDPGEWYCSTCRDNIPDIALSTSRIGGSVSAVLAGSTDEPDVPPPLFPQFDHLRQVVAVGHRAVVNHLAVTVFSAELFDDGFRVQLRIQVEPPHPQHVPGGLTPDYDDPDAPHGRMLQLQSGFTIVDDLGGEYQCRPMLGGTVNRQEGALHCAPAVDPFARELLIHADSLLWHDVFRPARGFFIDNGPWFFRVPLNRY
ncbi:hypothetical protein AB0N05_06765 [Nocardia sp. NPDC051030]|uniref:hypothetical protein n=1 Tax=Nocardia sp. NPDC051030 TaxID=3155162 RepID=UPI003438816B